jgi:hypothetical protein
MSTVWASVQDELESAARHEQIAFILVPDRGATDVDQAGDIIQQALLEVKSSTLIEPDRSDEENSGLVGKHRLAGAPGRCEFQEA